METGDWAQSIIGGLGILATLAVAWMVYRLQRRDRDLELFRRQEVEQRQEEERAKRAREQEAARLEAEAERERRALRREQHRDDYQAATKALDRLAEVFEQAKSGFLTQADWNESGASEALDVLKPIRRRVPALDEPLQGVWLYSTMLEGFPAPAASRFADALAQKEPMPAGIALSRLVRSAVINGRGQRDAALKGAKAIENARQAIAREWGS